MTKTAQTELHRLFLIESLPEPLTRASAHLQIFDTYIVGTRLRLRRMRDPSTKSWTTILQQQQGVGGAMNLAEIYLNDEEFQVLERLQGTEARKNRYFHEFDTVPMAFDVYLGRLTGLVTAKAYFDDRDRLEDFIKPPFALLEVTGNESFDGPILSVLDINELRSRLKKKKA